MRSRAKDSASAVVSQRFQDNRSCKCVRENGVAAVRTLGQLYFARRPIRDAAACSGPLQIDRLAIEGRELAARIDEVDQPLGERLREMDERLGVRNALVSAVGAVGVLRRAGPERVRGAVLPARDASSKATWGRRRPLSDIAVFCPLSENACQSGFGFAT
jgi:hypothetical protein